MRRAVWSRIALAVAAAAGVGAAPAPGEAAQTAGGAPVAEERRVTAIDLVVELNRRGRSDEPLAPPKDLAASDLRVSRAGVPAPVVGLAPPDGPVAEPWTIVLYFDRPLASSHTVRWAAEALAERSEALVALGEVEIVVADPEPRWALAPSREPRRLDEALSGLYLSGGGPSRLVALREKLLIGGREGPSRGGSPAAARRLLRRELEVVRRQGDRLLARLLDHAPATPRRALVWVSDGFDLRPAEFYRRQGPDAARGLTGLDLAADAHALADTLAAYGWVVAALAPPPPAEGVERFGVIPLRRPPERWLFALSLRSISTWLDKNRDPKKADAYVELGRALRDQGKLEDAVEAFRKAVYHYYNHPKTAERQAAALVELGETLERAGEGRRARAALRAATAYDPALVSMYPFAAAELAAPHQPLDELATRTAGRRIAEASDLDRLLESLGRRLRLTYQLAGPPDGSLGEVRIDHDLTLFDLRHPRSGRWGTPPAVAELRLRALLDGSLEGGDLAVRAEWDGGRTLAVETPLPEAEDPGDGRPVRLSWAARGRRGETRYGHATVDGGAAAGRGWLEAELEISLPPGPRWIAVLAEDLAATSWGGAVVEVRREPAVGSPPAPSAGAARRRR